MKQPTTAAEAQTIVEAHYSKREVAASEFDHAEWESARPVQLTRYWSGAQAPPSRHAEARLIWTDAALAVRFRCPQSEPLIISSEPRVEQKTIGLWDRDVCEIFVAPGGVPEEAHAVRYFEFEAAPTGEWLDLAILWKARGERETVWDYRSGMTAAARVEEGSVVIAMRVPWEAFADTTAAGAPTEQSPSSSSTRPRAGDCWRANLFRCVGEGETRGYIAWQPTETPEPSFHVPHRFGWLRFEG